MTIPFTEAELEVLMARPICRLLTAADRKAFAGRRVLITGAGEAASLVIKASLRVWRAPRASRQQVA